jgi:SAM-dependent methyltransferase
LELPEAMSMDAGIKHQVQEFYDQVGWQRVGECCFQNARFEDLRPVTQEYIHRCHMRVARHLPAEGNYFLDAGSGPIQYPEYLEYSGGYRYRVCVDLSIVALKEARERLGRSGLYIIADVANLPFRSGGFDAVVSLHTIHHLPKEEHLQAYKELHRVMANGSSAVVVNGWCDSLLMTLLKPFMWTAAGFIAVYRRLRGAGIRVSKERFFYRDENQGRTLAQKTHAVRRSYSWLVKEVGSKMPLHVYAWRSVSTPFLKTVIHRRIGGRWLLRLIFWLEERFPHFMGRFGQYPLVVLQKTG